MKHWENFCLAGAPRAERYLEEAGGEETEKAPDAGEGLPVSTGCLDSSTAYGNPDESTLSERRAFHFGSPTLKVAGGRVRCGSKAGLGLQ